MSKLHSIIPGQVPEFVRSNYPAFLEFVQAYYRWLDSLSAAYGDITDLDNTPAEFVKYFKQQLDVFNIVSSSEYFDKRYLKYIKEIYATKGSEQFLTRILELAYNSRVNVDYPGKYMLRASDGKWVREAFIVLTTEFGTLPTTFEYIYIKNLNNERVRVNHYDVLENNKVRIYFDSTVQVDINSNELVEIKSGSNIVYVGRVNSVPNGIQIINGGTDWSIGKIFTISGTYVDSICKVNKVSSTGAIVHASIYEHGYEHTTGNIDISNGSTTIVKLTFNGISKLEGYWKDDSGKISHQSIKLQDNFYYQLFSYVVSSDIPTFKYIDLAEKVNPAGNKLFTNFDTANDVTLIITGETRVPSKSLFFGPEFIEVTDLATLAVTKVFTDSATSSEILIKLLTKLLPDTATISDTNIAKSLTKVRTESVTASETFAKTFAKVLSEIVTISESKVLALTKAIPDTINITESYYKTISQVKTDTVTASHGAPVITTASPYNSETYFSETYNAAEVTITI